MKQALLLAIIAAPVLASCAGLGGPGARSPDVRISGFGAPGDFAISDRTLDRWWELYEDAELTGLVNAGLANNTDVRTAIARLEESRAARASVLRSLLPRGDVTGAAELRETQRVGAGATSPTTGGQGFFRPAVGRQNSQNLDFPISFDPDPFGRNVEARRTINAEFLASRYAYEGVRAAVAAQIADTYFLARGTAVQLEEARETLRITRELSRVTRIRAERGLAASSEFSRAETERANAEAEIARLEAESRADRRGLLVLLGRPAEAIDDLPMRAELYDPPQAPSLVSGDLLVRRPDVREAQARIEAASGNLRRARLALLPSFTFRPSLGTSRLENVFFTSATSFWALGANVLLPVLDRPRLLAEIQVNGARAEQAVIAYERAVQTAFSEADRSLIQLQGDRARVSQLTDAVSRARSAYEAAQRGYQAGLTDLQALLDAERAYRSTRSNLSGARTLALQRSVLVFRALGGGWSSELTQNSAQAAPRP